ncbi:MAG: type II toxin-antitoxin system VapC family toxin [Holophagales bacterium]|nr:type II toxin-antitoxin system VapC family toxin [Holophagales bacterium]MYC10442.1 type II toxin-antitoxin system VapC family toxin [Holophagales bacterium]
MTYLLDTNVVSEGMKTRPEPRVVAWFLEHRAAEVYMSTLTLGELVRGARKHPDEGKRRVLETWIRDDLARQFKGRILPFDAEAAVMWGDLLAAGDQAGLRLPAVDAQIAAVARRHGMTVVTRNVRDFSLMNVPLLNPWSEQGG